MRTMRTLAIPIALLLFACNGEEKPKDPRPSVKKPVDTRPLFRGTVLTKVGEKPVAGAKIVAQLPFGAGKAGHDGLVAISDAEGEFAIDIEGDLKPTVDSPVILAVSMDGYVKRQWSLPTYAPGRGRTVTVFLERSGTVIGEIVTKDGEPVADAIVYAIRADLPGVRLPVQVIHVTTGEDGTYRLPGLPGGKIDIGAKAKDLRFALVQDVTVVPGEETPLAAITLLPGKTISGRAVLKGGKDPAERTVVRVWRDPAFRDFVLFGRRAIANGGGVSRVDEEGRWSVSGLGDGNYDVDAITLGLVGDPGGAQNVPAGTTDLELVFVKAAKVVIRVVDGETNEKMKRFSLVIQALTGPKDAEGRPVIREEADVRSPVGEYSFPAREDEIYGIEILAEGYEIERRTVGPLTGGAPEVTTVLLKRRE